MKNSIANRVSRRVSHLLVTAMVILFIGSYFVVWQAISDQTERYNTAAVGMYSELLEEYSRKNGIPIDPEHPDEVIRLGECICTWYGADFVYVYEIEEDPGAVRYVGAAFYDSEVPMEYSDNLVGHYVPCELRPEELAVWHEEKTFGILTEKFSWGHEITTLRMFEDCRGSRYLAGVDFSFRSMAKRVFSEFALLAAAVAAVLFCVWRMVYRILKKQVSAPAQVISRHMEEYISDGSRSSEKLPVTGSDEYAAIAASFNSMSDDIESYVQNIQDLTREQANRQTELEIAAAIQRGLLPGERMDGDDCSIRAVMRPARDVGGDLYDYFRLDDGRVLIVIADVSGKGISASMFMTVTLTLIRQFAKMGLAPHEILRRTNDSLAENNARFMFVTAFIGIYDGASRTLTYANAGHNIPYAVGNELVPLTDARGLLLGIFEGEEYSSRTIPLQPGDVVFLYTDGVTEAVDAGDRFYGKERLEGLLAGLRASGADDPVDQVLRDVAAFAEGAEQFDDITMLALTVKDGGARPEETEE